MSIYIDVINHRGPADTGSITAGVAVQLFSGGGFASRRGIEIRNVSGSASIYVETVSKGSAAPTISSTTAHAKIPPDSTVTFSYGTGLDVYLDATAAADYVASEVLS